MWSGVLVVTLNSKPSWYGPYYVPWFGFMSSELKKASNLVWGLIAGCQKLGPFPNIMGLAVSVRELYRDFVPEILTCVLSVGMSFLPRLPEVSNTRSSYTPQARNTIILIIGTHKEGHGCRTFPSIFLRDKKGHAIFLPPAIPKNDNRKYRTTQKIVVDCIH